MNKRRRLVAAVLGLGLCCSTPAAMATENLVFTSGAFRRSIPVADLEHLATTGEARGLLADVLRLGRQDPKQVSKLLNESVKLPIVLMSRLLNTRIGEAILARLARILFPLRAPEAGVPALRAAMVLGTYEGKGSLSAITFLRAYPTRELEVSIPALMGLASKASSISELVRFFSESPLDGLRGNEPQAAPAPSAATPAPAAPAP
ncbi:alpha/beta hydrolase [Synechococcus sp. BO 8801]|uniref:alpha/beta hydrolase n=1 Tax=Synechococcus sp. BO 8801 TaxID=169670 RepID=UPI000B987A47|nr:alpha/beta hydrolase [Synechococcus sp. BO 8801]